MRSAITPPHHPFRLPKLLEIRERILDNSLAMKSSVGIEEADDVEPDLVIIQRDGRLLPEIIQQDGVEGFLSIENRVNASINTHNTIIATGGSVVFGDGAMFHLSSIGTIVYLRASYEKFANHIIDVDEQSIEATAQELAKIARAG